MKLLSKLVLAAALAAGMAGAATAQPPGGGRQGGMAGMMGGGANVYGLLATNKDLIEELKISDEQKAKLLEVGKAAREKMTGSFGRFNPDATDEERKAMREKMEKMMAEVRADYEKVLDDKQKARVKQITYQAMGVSAYGNKDVQEALKFTDDQKESVKGMMDEFLKERGELMRGAFGDRGAGGDREEMQKKMEEMRKKTTALGKEYAEKIEAKMTDAQKSEWKKLQGDKFDVTKLTQAPRQRRDD
jgi:Spy/CpxP family protein refolding chaperone